MVTTTMSQMLMRVWCQRAILLHQGMHASAPIGTTIGTTAARHAYSSTGENQPLSKEAAVRRLLYRSKQRGFLELDLLVGLWAERNIATLTDQQLNDLTVLLDQENPNLYKWLTGQAQPPAEMTSNAAFQSIRKEVQTRLQQHSVPRSRAGGSAAWVRGWDDGQRGGAAQ